MSNQQGSLHKVIAIFKVLGSETGFNVFYGLSDKVPRRFSELNNKLGITEGNLNYRLKEFERAGLVLKNSNGEYETTDLYDAARQIIQPIFESVKQNLEGEISDLERQIGDVEKFMNAQYPK